MGNSLAHFVVDQVEAEVPYLETAIQPAPADNHVLHSTTSGRLANAKMKL